MLWTTPSSIQMSNLPEWIKDLNSIMQPGVFPNLERTLEALAIAWEALDGINKIRAKGNAMECLDFARQVSFDAIHKIKELGDSSNGPKKTNNLTYEDTV